MAEDNGKTDLIVGRDEKTRLVILRFQEPREWVGFDPENAVAVGEAMSKEAYYLRFGKTPGVEAPAMQDQIRERLVNTVTLMLNSMQKERRSPAMQAQHVVDHMLSRVF